MVLSDLSSSLEARDRQARIVSLVGPLDLIERMREMGFCEGAAVDLVRRLPFGGPWIVQIGASAFALREEEARCATIELVSA